MECDRSKKINKSNNTIKEEIYPYHYDSYAIETNKDKCYICNRNHNQFDILPSFEFNQFICHSLEENKSDESIFSSDQ